MKKKNPPVGRLLLIIALCFAAVFPLIAQSAAAQTAPAPDRWLTDFNEAKRIAQTENKKILINFTGSDWCTWCHKLRDEVFSTKAFLDYANSNLVLLYVDFPNSSKLSESQSQHNQLLASIFNIKGFPTVIVLDPDLTPRLQTGYTGTSPAIYNLHLNNEKNIPSSQAAMFKQLLIRQFP